MYEECEQPVFKLLRSSQVCKLTLLTIRVIPNILFGANSKPNNVFVIWPNSIVKSRPNTNNWEV